MATKEQLISALRRHFSNVDDGLATVPATGRILGFIASDDFADADHEQRLAMLWDVIGREFSAEDQRNIGPITVMTHDEARLHTVDTD